MCRRRSASNHFSPRNLSRNSSTLLDSRIPSTLSWISRYYLPEIAKIFRVQPMPRNCVQHQKGLSDDAFERLYPDEEACRKAWFAWRWPEGFKCPRCAGSNYCEIRGRQLDFPLWSGGVRPERHAAARMVIPSMLARASAGVR